MRQTLQGPHYLLLLPTFVFEIGLPNWPDVKSLQLHIGQDISPDPNIP